ncbi:MAG: hypothetical protein ACXVJF_15915 [Acidimicrobiia bacterium]
MSTAGVRRVGRATRRVVAGARGLGVTTTARWGLHRLSGGAVDAANTSLTWIRADAAHTTVVWINNYWSDAYDIAEPHLTATILDRSGSSLAEVPIDLAPDCTVALDVRTLCRDHAVALPFTGQLLLRLAHERLVPGRPVQVFAEYRRDDGECSGVHGQYGLVATPVAQVVSAMRVEPTPETRTGFVITNGYDGPGAPHDMRAELTVADAAGRERHAVLPPVPARGTLVTYADEAIEDLAAFLDGHPGHARIRLACPSSRIATFLESVTDGTTVVNHGTVDRVFDQEAGISGHWTSSWPVASAFAQLSAGRDTVIGLPNVWGPRADDYTAVLDLFDLDGRPVGRHEVTVARNGMTEVSIRDLVGLEHAALHVEVSLRPVGHAAERPHTFDILVGVRVDGVLRAEAQVGSEFSNAPVPDGVRWPDIRRTRIFGRVDATDGRRTVLFLAFPVAGAAPVAPTRPLLTLVSADGTRRSTTEVELAPHGGLLAPVDELFADAAEILGPEGRGQVRVRDTSSRLYGYTWVEHPHAATFPLDHLIGG